VFTERKGDVVEHAEVGEERPELEQHAHAPAGRVELGLRQLADVLAVKCD
jgi:hypothetical protein